jgi:hypothetical protein
MKITIDASLSRLFIDDGAGGKEFPLFGPEAFAEISRQWMRIGWSLDYYHRFQWMGVPVLQLPEDLFRLQEVFYRVRPDYVVETGYLLRRLVTVRRVAVRGDRPWARNRSGKGSAR